MRSPAEQEQHLLLECNTTNKPYLGLHAATPGEPHLKGNVGLLGEVAVQLLVARRRPGRHILRALRLQADLRRGTPRSYAHLQRDPGILVQATVCCMGSFRSMGGSSMPGSCRRRGSWPRTAAGQTWRCARPPASIAAQCWGTARLRMGSARTLSLAWKHAKGLLALHAAVLTTAGLCLSACFSNPDACKQRPFLSRHARQLVSFVYCRMWQMR